MHLEPIVSFAILLSVILIVPLIFERLKLPGLLGLLIAGFALGPQGLNLLHKESETLKLLSDIGLVYLMFVAGLEIDIHQFQQTKHRSAGFGTLTFLVPLIAGTIVGQMFGFGWNASILIGSLFASHTLLAYPIISRLGVINNEAVIVTVGATIFTDIGALLVLAVCVGIHQGEFTTLSLAKLLLGLIIYSAVILFGFKWLGQEFFRRTRDDEGNQFLFVLLVVFISALGAEVIGVEKIVGAFLAGLAVNGVIGSGPVKEKVVFVGNVLFIPIFFISLGLLVNVQGFIRSLSSLWLTLAIVVGLIGSKFTAALLAKLLYRYSWREMITMWSLSLPQVAATLAATLVGYRVGLLTENVLNGVIVLMIVTATLGPIITSRSAAGLTVTMATSPVETTGSLLDWKEDPSDALTVVVPVHNPKTERHLIEMAALLVRRESGKIVALAVSPALHMDSPELEESIAQSTILLSNAVDLGREFGVEVEPLARIDQSIPQGISHASREENSSLIVMGWGEATGLRVRLFGSVIDRVFWASHCPVAVTRLLDSPSNIQRILVPLENLEQAERIVRFAEILAAANQAEVILLHVCDRYTSSARIDWMKSQLEILVSKHFPENRTKIKVQPADNVVNAILDESQSCDLIVLRSLRRRLSIGQVAVSDVTTEVVKHIQCSVVLLGEPQGYHENLRRVKAVVKT